MIDDAHVEFGVRLNSLDVGLGAEAVAIEAQGWDFLAVGEHVSFNVPTASSLISLAAAAAATTRIGLMSAITLLPLYPPGLIAKQVAALDSISGGRFVLGVGVGGENPAEFDACGVPVRERGARADETLAVLRALWSGTSTNFDGRFVTFRDVTVSPSPKSPPPIWVAGRGERAQLRAGRYADGWLPYLCTPEMLAASLASARAAREDDRPLAGGAYLWTCVHEDPAVAREYAVATLGAIYRQDFSKLADRYLVIGDPETCRRRVGEYIAAGATRVVFADACPAEAIGHNRDMLAATFLPAVR